MTGSLESHRSRKGFAMIIVRESAAALKGRLAKTSLNALGRTMVLRMVLRLILHRGRMSCSQAAGSIASESVHRGEVARFLARALNRTISRFVLQKARAEARSVLETPTQFSPVGQEVARVSACSGCSAQEVADAAKVVDGTGSRRWLSGR